MDDISTIRKPLPLRPTSCDLAAGSERQASLPRTIPLTEPPPTIGLTTGSQFSPARYFERQAAEAFEHLAAEIPTEAADAVEEVARLQELQAQILTMTRLRDSNSLRRLWDAPETAARFDELEAAATDDL